MRDDFSQKTKETLARRVGMRCSNPGCRKPTAGPASSPTDCVNIGVAAHITAASPGGPRYNEKCSPEQRCSIENGLWLCQNCAKLIDSDPTRYTKEALIQWKELSEKLAHDEVSVSPSDSGSRSTEELVTITEVRAAAVLDAMANAQCKALSEYRQQTSSDQSPDEKTRLPVETAVGNQATQIQHFIQSLDIRDGRSRWTRYANETDLVSKLETMKTKFIDLHRRHKAELAKHKYVVAHELVGQIHDLIEEFTRAANPPYPRINLRMKYYCCPPSEDEMAHHLVNKHAHYPGLVTPSLLLALPVAYRHSCLSEGDNTENLRKAKEWHRERARRVFERISQALQHPCPRMEEDIQQERDRDK